MRREYCVRFEPSLAALGGALYMGLMLAEAYALYRLEWLSVVSAFGLTGLGSLLVSLWVVVRLCVKWLSFRDEPIRGPLEDHQGYGRWATPLQMLAACPLPIYHLALPILYGFEVSASVVKTDRVYDLTSTKKGRRQLWDRCDVQESDRVQVCK